MISQIKFLATIFLAASLFAACKKDDPEIPNEEEVITSLDFILAPSGGGTTITLNFSDPDGDGGAAPVIVGDTLAANQTYTATLDLQNSTESITEEIKAEDEDHQFFFQSDIPGLNVAYNDADADGNPVGLSSTLTTGDPAAGSITIILRHQPDKSASGVADGDITNAGGETDIQVTIPVNVQ